MCGMSHEETYFIMGAFALLVKNEIGQKFVTSDCPPYQMAT